MLSPDPSPFKAIAPQELAEASILACAGPDAAAFLQAQLMNDVRLLEPGHWHWNGWLNAKGRVLCLFALWRRDAEEFWLLLPDFPATELLPLLQRYVFRSKAKLQVRADYTLAGSVGSIGDGDTHRDLALPFGDGWQLDLSGADHAR